MDLTCDFNEISPLNGGRPEALVVVMHGLGQRKETFNRVATYLANKMPYAKIVIPQGSMTFSEGLPLWVRPLIQQFMSPEKFKRRLQGRSWFGINPVTLPMHVKFNHMTCVDSLNSMISQQLKIAQLPDSKLALFGFSQGGTMAMFAGLKRQQPCGAIVAHSASLPVKFEPTSMPKVDLVKGEIEIRNCEKPSVRLIGMSHEGTLHRLDSMRVPRENHVISGMGHTITVRSLEVSYQIMQRRLDQAQP